MANIFIHFEPIGPLGEENVIDPDLPQYIIRGKWYPSLKWESILIQWWTDT
jgi:hypothetical protein